AGNGDAGGIEEILPSFEGRLIIHPGKVGGLQGNPGVVFEGGGDSPKERADGKQTPGREDDVFPHRPQPDMGHALASSSAPRVRYRESTVKKAIISTR